MSDRQILVAYATGSGSTTEVAQAIGDELAEGGIPVEVQLAKKVEQVRSYRAVVLGSAIRVGRWLPDAVRFLEAFQEDLATMPVAFFTTCLTMVEDSEDSRRIVLDYMEPVLDLVPEVEPVGLGLFAGALNPTLRQVVPAGPYGDYRNWEAIRAWAREIRPALLAGRLEPRRSLALSEAVLSYTDMSGTDLRRADLRRADLRRSKLSQTSLQDADLRKSDLTRADLRDADLRQANLGWADLHRSDLQGARLAGANLMGADLRQANLARADLAAAVLNGADLSQAHLQEAILDRCDLNWANLSGADLSGASLRGANLGWADFSSANLDQAVLKGARYNSQTQWPRGFSASEAGCVFVPRPY